MLGVCLLCSIGRERVLTVYHNPLQEFSSSPDSHQSCIKSFRFQDWKSVFAENLVFNLSVHNNNDLYSETRMHSSGMCTIHCSNRPGGCLPKRGVCSGGHCTIGCSGCLGGVCLRGVSAQGLCVCLRGCLPRGVAAQG